MEVNSKNYIKCQCGKLPVIIRGIHPVKSHSVFHIECQNPRCKYKPATADYKTQFQAQSAWNNKIVTDYMF